jgi:tetratricopeptide (TPR) repeat protein
MKKYLPLIILFFISNTCFACGNEYYRTELPLDSGKINFYYLLSDEDRDVKIINPYWVNGFGDDIYTDRDRLYKMYQKTQDYKYLSDYAWTLVKCGQTKEAISILDSLQIAHPNEYNILANLGTANEILGNNKKALDLLKKAVALNPNSHYGSEWIHLNILKYKLSKDSFPLEKIIDLGFLSYDMKQWYTDKWTYRIPADSLLKSIAYQLHERIGFIGPKDTIIGRLVLDFADIVTKTKGIETALPFYDFALYYDNELYFEIRYRKIDIEKLKTGQSKAAAPYKEKNNTGAFLAMLILLIPLAYFIGKRFPYKSAL